MPEKLRPWPSCWKLRWRKAHWACRPVFYQQAFAADMAEMQALVRVLGRHAGVYVTHIRTEMDDILSAMQEAADTAQAGPATWIMSHHKCAGPRNWGRTIETLALLERLSQRQSVGTDVYPYSAGSTLLREDLVDGVIDILITRSDPHPEMAGRYMADIAEEWGVDQLQACRRHHARRCLLLPDARRRCAARDCAPAEHDRL